MNSKRGFGVIFLTLLALFLVGCQRQTTTGQVATPIAVEGTHAEHSGEFACPMHPEVTGKDGDKCPKCGMKLEPAEPSSGTEMAQVAMQFSATPTAAKAKEGVTLSMTPKLKDSPAERVELDLEHTKKVHLIVVSDDLSWFDHIHPEEQSDGSYSVVEKFPTAGEYTVFADYKPTGAEHVVDKFTVKIDGDAATAKAYDSERLTGDAGDGFVVQLSSEGGPLKSNTPLHLAGKVTRNGKDVDVGTLEDYLGAKAHMVVLSVNEKQYLHVHPDMENGQFDLHTTFDKPGMYRGWLQFQNEGKVHTSDFVLNVQEGPKTPSTPSSEHDHH